MPNPGGLRVLRWLAALLIRGPDAAFIRADLDDTLERELARGVPPWRAWWRHAANVIGSALSVWRAGWRRHSPPGSWLDVKLGLRMLVKHPGLTVVSVVSLAIGIPVGLAPGHLLKATEAPLPVEDGDRIQMLRYSRPGSGVAPTTIYDLMVWREALTRFEAVGAVRQADFNVASVTSPGSPARVAEITASTFAILRASPLLGRTFDAADEAIDGPAVAVIGYELWQSRLGGGPDVIGSTLFVSGAPLTVVGVMPEAFLFPMHHELWLPLREGAVEPGQGNRLLIFGRLAEGASPEIAEAELGAVRRGLAGSFPDYDGLQAEVVPFTTGMYGYPKGGLIGAPEFRIGFRVVQLLALGLLVVACANVGLLIFARIASRSGELAVRTALGASRARIVSQVFTEGLVIAVLAAAVGLLLIDRLPGLLLALMWTPDWAPLPYWVDLGVTPSTVFQSLLLGVFSAGVAAVVPAFRITGKAIQQNIQRSQGARSGVRFGGMSGVLVVADVAIAVATVGLAVGISDMRREASDGAALSGIHAGEFLAVQIRMGVEPGGDQGSVDRSAWAVRRGASQQALVERIEAEPGVRGVAVANVLPRMDHPVQRIEVDGAPPLADVRGHRVRTARVDLNFFNALGRPILMGRAFSAADLAGDRSAVIVNATFVDRVLGGQNPIGRRLRYTSSAREAGLVAPMPEDDEPERWYEIVGVVEPLGMDILDNRATGGAGLYHAMAPGEINPVRLAIHVGDDPMSLAPRLRELARQVDPTAMIEAPGTLDKRFPEDWYLMAVQIAGGVILVGILLALASSGIYAIMSFTVAQRTREIGIRRALGARPDNIVSAIGGRALAQLGAGAVLGMPVAGWLFFALQQDPEATRLAFLVGVVPGVSVMLLIGLLACTAPTLRALRIKPTEALRGGG